MKIEELTLGRALGLLLLILAVRFALAAYIASTLVHLQTQPLDMTGALLLVAACWLLLRPGPRR